MKVYLPVHSGFCPGVKLAEKKLLSLKIKSSGRDIYVLGKLIHNSRYIEYLKTLGINTSDDASDIPAGAAAVIRTHGIGRKAEEDLRSRLETVDLTCAKVKELQKYIHKESGEGFFTVITGKKDHPEVLGLVSYAMNGFFVIENEGDLENFINEFDRCILKILVVSQTTGKRSLFEYVSKKIGEEFSKGREIRINDSICSITIRREEESLKLQKKASLTFVIGDHTSANADKLYQKLKEENINTYFIEGLDDLKNLKLPLSGYLSALVVSSSSTPSFIEKETVDYLLGIKSKQEL
jgi:4-hydroxy-3-methylbut-2-enyl diphosphate reductase